MGTDPFAIRGKIRYMGVLAPASKWRRLVVPKTGPVVCEHEAEKDTSKAVTTAPKRSSQRPKAEAPKTGAGAAAADSIRVNNPSPQDTREKFRGRTSTSYIDWATLMRRGLGLDVLDCRRRDSSLQAKPWLQAARWERMHAHLDG